MYVQIVDFREAQLKYVGPIAKLRLDLTMRTLPTHGWLQGGSRNTVGGLK